ncbi:MAG TPA: phospholipid carrier-dependent glycosyltransferase [Aggregicoccus sp.]|nr:phospholipid carrier-dependent glycosyltransferase [Aggregicoccus sp.]
MPLRSARLLLWLLVAVAAALLADNLARPLANPDEGRYSEIAREMAASGDWITPRLNGVKYFEKPPLQYWAGAAAFHAFGATEVAARLYTSLAALLTVLLVGYTGRRLEGPDAGLGAVVALATSPYFLGMSGVVTLDAGLTLWTTATFCAFAIAQREERARGARRAWLLAAWAAMALAVLSKGLVGIVFPAAALVLYCLARRDLTPLVRLEWLPGLAVFLAIAAPWFVAVSAANPEFAEFFFVHEHLQRFTSSVHRRTEPWWYFLPILALGFLPWVLAWPAAIAHGLQADRREGGFRPMLFALAYAGFLVAFFSASGSKLPTYVLPAFPPLALVLGRYLAEAPPRRLGAYLLPLPLAAAALAVVAWQAPERAREAWSAQLLLQARPWALGGAALLASGGLVAAVLLRRGRRWAGLAALALALVAVADVAEEAFEEMSPRQSGLAVARKMNERMTPATRLYSVGHYEQTVPFYTGRTLTLVDYRDEFETGLASEPGLAIPALAEFPGQWLRPGEAMAIMQPGTYESFRAQGLPMQLLHEDPRRVLVRKP